MELDAVNFTDESFHNFISIRPAMNEESGGPSNTRKMKNVEILTDELYYRDAETNTKHKKESISVRVT